MSLVRILEKGGGGFLVGAVCTDVASDCPGWDVIVLHFKV